MTAMLENKWLSTQEVAALAGCTDSYVRQLIRAGKLQSEQIGQRSYVIPIEAAREFARKPRTTGRPRKSEKSE